MLSEHRHAPRSQRVDPQLWKRRALHEEEGAAAL